MSKIGESIRKITKAWGGKTYGSGIGDAIRDLADNLPFGVKTEMVEIVPEQSVKGDLNTGTQGNKSLAYLTKLNNLTIKENVAYKIVINGKEYFGKGQKVTITELGGEIGVAIGSMDYLKNSEETPLDNFEPNFAIATASGMTMAMWGTSFGKTITLAIYEEGEVVKPMDIKFLPIEELKKALGLDSPR